MLSEIKKISIEQWFFAAVFAIAMFLSFSAGYVYFRYWSAEACKSPMEIGYFGKAN